MFEWETPVVCPDEVRTEGCALTDEQLLYSFNLSSLSTSTFKVMCSPWACWRRYTSCCEAARSVLDNVVAVS